MIPIGQRPYRPVREARQAALDALDGVLVSGIAGYSAEKVSALRDIEAAAKRMADNIERWQRDALRAAEGRSAAA
jgi:hypothetical protein